MAEEEAAEHLAPARHHRNREVAPDRQVAGGHAVMRRILPVARILRHVVEADDALARERRREHLGVPRHRELAELLARHAGDGVEGVVLAACVDHVVEERPELGARDLGGRLGRRLDQPGQVELGGEGGAGPQQDLGLVAGQALLAVQQVALAFDPRLPDPDRDAVRDRAQGGQGALAQRLPGEQSHHADQMPADEERIAGERHHALAARPLLVADLWIPDHLVREMGPPVFGDHADLEPADRHPTVRAIEVRVLAGTGLQLEDLFGVVQRPDTREGRVKAADQRLSASLQLDLQHRRCS